MRKRAAGRDVDGVDAGLDQPLADLHRLLDGVAGRLRASGRAARCCARSALIFICRWKSRADARADRLDDLDDEARAVLERPAVFVGAIVDRRAQELRDEVAVGAVQLDAVESRLARPPRALGERRDRLP